MSIITLFSASYCQGSETSTRIAGRLGYRLLSDRDLAEYAADRMTPAKLLQALVEPPTLHSKPNRRKKRGLAYLREALATAALEDDLVFHGLSAQLLSQPLAHLLKIGLSAPRQYRLERAIVERGWTAETAQDRLRDDDAQREWLTQHLHARAPFDWRIYDLLVSASKTELKSVVDVVVTLAALPEVCSTDQSPQSAHDFLDAARVGAYLTELGYDVDVACLKGHAHIRLKQQPIHPTQLVTELQQLALSVPDVTAASVDVGPRGRASQTCADRGMEQQILDDLSPRSQRPHPGPSVQRTTRVGGSTSTLQH